MENRTETIEELNDILEKTYDAINGFKKAAELSTNLRLTGYFSKQINERNTFANELTAEVRRLGGEPKTDGTVGGSIHRAWIDFKSIFSRENNEEIIEECIRGEKHCIDEYNDLLEESHIPASTRQLLERQKRNVVKTLGELEIKEELHDD